MASGGFWNRAGRRSGGYRPVLITPGRTINGKEQPPSLILDEAFTDALIRYSDAKKVVFDCNCDGGDDFVCEHVRAAQDCARDIADRIVADPPAAEAADELLRRAAPPASEP